nr:uncharacterized protein LOC111419008 [Onthophagus taurus]
MSLKLILILIFVSKTYGNETTPNPDHLEIEEFCKNVCSNPNWDFTCEKKTSTCICWVDNNLDDIDAKAMQKQAINQGIILWVIRKRDRLARDLNNTTNNDTENTTEQSTIEIKPRINEENEEKSPKSILKKYKPTEKSTKSDPIVGDAPKSILPRLNHKGLVANLKSCNTETIKLNLQNVKAHLNRLLERFEHPQVNCGLLTSELEGIKSNLQQLIVRVGEKKDLNERPRLIDQLRGREKERHAKFQSRFGQLDLHKKKNILGSAKNDDVITQPKEFIDNKK